MLEEGELPSPDSALPGDESTGDEGMAAGLLAVGAHGSTAFSSVTVAFTQDGWRHLVPAPRGTPRFKEGLPENARNLVLLGGVG